MMRHFDDRRKRSFAAGNSPEFETISLRRDASCRRNDGVILLAF